MPRATAVMVALLMSPFLAMTAASAHAQLVAISPADGSTLASMPGKAKLEFDEPISAADAVLVTPAQEVGKLASGVDGTKVVFKLPGGGPRGEYTLTYRVVSEDGHVVTDDVHFTVVRGQAPKISAAASGKSYSFPLAGVIGGAAALLFIAIVLVVVKVRR